jgi:MFS transporter, DHA1 family, inner membrane transport protein
MHDNAPSTPAPSTPSGAAWRFRVAPWVLAFATAVVVTTEFIVVGLLPMMVNDLGVTIADGGGLVSWFAVAAAVGGPLLTIAAGGISPRRIFQGVLLVFVAGNLMTALAPAYALLVVIRIIEGAALPVLVSIGSVALAQIAGDDRSARGVAVIYLGVVVGIVLAVPAGVMLADVHGWPVTFLVLASLSLVAMLLCGLFPATDATTVFSRTSQVVILRRPVVLAHLVLSAIIGTALFAPYTYLAAYLARVMGFNPDRVALLLLWFGLAGVVGNSMAGRVAARGPTATTMAVAALLMVVTAVMPLIPGNQALLLPVLALWGAVHAATFLVSQVRVMRVAPEAPAFASSLNISAGNIGIAAGAIVGGWVVRHAGLDAIGYGGLAFAACALVLATVLNLHHEWRSARKGVWFTNRSRHRSRQAAMKRAH